VLFSSRLILPSLAVLMSVFPVRTCWAGGVCEPVPEHERLPYHLTRTDDCPEYDAHCVESWYRVCPARDGVAHLQLEALAGEWFEVAHHQTFWRMVARMGATDARVAIELDAPKQQLRLRHSARRCGSTEWMERTLEWPCRGPRGSGHLRMCQGSLTGERCQDAIVWEVADDGSYFVMGDASGENVTIYGRAAQLPAGEVTCLLDRLVDAHCFLRSVHRAKIEPHRSPR
jgi:hypothetical protein